MKENNNFETVYLYVNSFEWKNDRYKEMYGDLPAKGRVYQAEIMELDGETFHRVTLFPNRRDGMGVALKELVGDFENFSCDIAVINEENIIEFDINPDDMDMVIKDETHEQSDVTSEVSRSLDIRDVMLQNLHGIYELDETTFRLLAMLAGTTFERLSTENIGLTEGIGSMDGDTGRVVNISIAAHNLERHLTSPDNNPSHLLEAFHAILSELKRTTHVI